MPKVGVSDLAGMQPTPSDALDASFCFVGAVDGAAFHTVPDPTRPPLATPLQCAPWQRPGIANDDSGQTLTRSRKELESQLNSTRI